ncbi:MAG: UDP-N-acetylmuramoyl-L-alanine--D-glutamate ligase [Alphaproteobacteria bacterium]|nr:UDP-N-acetylmuramoyl-L-alanine--D-glutamate ligase [Alphaproteobacteria bacterium]
MVNLDFAKGRTYAVMGLGKSGAAAARALARAGAAVLAWDDTEAGRSRVVGMPGVELVDLTVRGLGDVDALVLSPGIPHTHPAPHPVAADAKTRDLSIVGDVELLLRALPDRRVVAITGTNGKSTTTALIGHILAEAGLPVQVGGNLGRPALEFEDPGRDGVLVLELSSYQLEITPSLAPTVAILLNITPDHIERHGTFAGYIAAKRRIFSHQSPGSFAVIGVDDEPSHDVAEKLRRDGRRLIEISGQEQVVGGVYADHGVLIDARTGQPKRIVDLERAPALPGIHNAQNAAAAAAACLALGLSSDAIAAAIASFPGLAHRLERVAVTGTVTYVNDSKATNADATARALACYDPIYWIAGGRAKEGGIEPLAPLFGRVKRAYLIGESAGAFVRQIGDACPTVLCRTLDSAVRQAHADAQKDGLRGATVLLSPAAASFDQFPNFEMRGEEFRSLVHDLTGGDGGGIGGGIGEHRRAS